MKWTHQNRKGFRLLLRKLSLIGGSIHNSIAVIWIGWKGIWSSVSYGIDFKVITLECHMALLGLKGLAQGIWSVICLQHSVTNVSATVYMVGMHRIPPPPPPQKKMHEWMTQQMETRHGKGCGALRDCMTVYKPHPPRETRCRCIAAEQRMPPLNVSWECLRCSFGGGGLALQRLRDGAGTLRDKRVRRAPSAHLISRSRQKSHAGWNAITCAERRMTSADGTAHKMCKIPTGFH